MATAALALKMPGTTMILPRSIKTEDRPIQGTAIFTPERLDEWNRPEFQRPLLINQDVQGMARKMMLEAAADKEGMCSIPGIILFGRFLGDDYLLDGQHRIFGAFALACGKRALEGTTEFLTEGGVRPKMALASTETRHYNSLSEMAQAFVNAQKKLVALKADDSLRALEYTNTYLRDLREACPFIGYEKNKNTKDRIMISMSAAIRTWFGSGATPATGPECSRAASYLDETETARLISFFIACERAGWVDSMWPNLWGTLNIGLNMWLWRKLVLGKENKFRGGGDFMALTVQQYAECMKGLKTPEYAKFLKSRALRFQDRLITYEYIQDLFMPELARQGIIGPKFPVPQGWGVVAR